MNEAYDPKIHHSPPLLLSLVGSHHIPPAYALPYHPRHYPLPPPPSPPPTSPPNSSSSPPTSADGLVLAMELTRLRPDTDENEGVGCRDGEKRERMRGCGRRGGRGERRYDRDVGVGGLRERSGGAVEHAGGGGLELFGCACAGDAVWAQELVWVGRGRWEEEGLDVALEDHGGGRVATILGVSCVRQVVLETFSTPFYLPIVQDSRSDHTGRLDPRTYLPRKIALFLGARMGGSEGSELLRASRFDQPSNQGTVIFAIICISPPSPPDQTPARIPLRYLDGTPVGKLPPVTRALIKKNDLRFVDWRIEGAAERAHLDDRGTGRDTFCLSKGPGATFAGADWEYFLEQSKFCGWPPTLISSVKYGMIPARENGQMEPSLDWERCIEGDIERLIHLVVH
ncbi:hypothetical protein DFP72DRAFT_862077 [Ephemerocybe angulata]|uniref:Uncharacterized protein n=1 Tax=Ephemerocybe angulata TaxID=980116 RepID=A0A8H6H8N6_9AGAR|nr:hypothetical protein DFP72DRAFT_862077 [Tulosesus angulatus]